MGRGKGEGGGPGGSIASSIQMLRGEERREAGEDLDFIQMFGEGRKEGQASQMLELEQWCFTVPVRVVATQDGTCEFVCTHFPPHRKKNGFRVDRVRHDNYVT